MPRAATGTAFESGSAGASAAIGATTTAVGTATAAIRASATIVATTVPSAAAKRPLEARARVTADTRGITREIFARSRCSAYARRARFAGKENYVLFDDGGACRDRFDGGRGREHFFFDMFSLEDMSRIGVFRFRTIALKLVLGMFVFSEPSSVKRSVVREVRFGFGAIDGALLFDILRFFRGEFGDFFGMNFLCLGMLLFRFFFLFLKFGAADNGVGLRLCRSFFVFGFDETGGQRGHLVFIQFGLTAGGFRFDDVAFHGGNVFRFGRRFT
jgi:hypothetical protein